MSPWGVCVCEAGGGWGWGGGTGMKATAKDQRPAFHLFVLFGGWVSPLISGQFTARAVFVTSNWFCWLVGNWLPWKLVEEVILGVDLVWVELMCCLNLGCNTETIVKQVMVVKSSSSFKQTNNRKALLKSNWSSANSDYNCWSVTEHPGWRSRLISTE